MAMMMMMMMAPSCRRVPLQRWSTITTTTRVLGGRGRICNPTPTSSVLLLNHQRLISSTATTTTNATNQPPPTPPPQQQQLIDFRDHRAAFASKSTFEIVRALVTLRVCSWEFLVKNSNAAYDQMTRIIGKPLVHFFIRHTFFKHFCAGETATDIRPTVHRLSANGVGSILDFAAEEDSTSSNPADKSKKLMSARVFPTNIAEAECDKHCETFLECVRAAAQFEYGFAAIKVTALGRPALLERVTKILGQIRALFAEFDVDGTKQISYAEFSSSLDRLGVQMSSDARRDLFAQFDQANSGYIDIYEWMEYLKVKDLRTRPFFTEPQNGRAKKLLSSLNDDEVQQVDRMFDRLRRIANAAAEQKVRLMIDAEQTYFQPAIAHTVIQLQREYNTGAYPIIFNTYQCYLKDTSAQVEEDMQRCRREGFKWGGKLVRGAYIVAERARAEELGYTDPTWPTIEATHKCYNECLEYVLKNNDIADVMVASHNQETAQLAVRLMDEYNIDRRKGGVSFGQLLGMSDNITMLLGAAGYRAYKYVPYGPIDKVIPYLLRRAQENSALLGSDAAKLERQLFRRELKARFRLG